MHLGSVPLYCFLNCLFFLQIERHASDETYYYRLICFKLIDTSCKFISVRGNDHYLFHGGRGGWAKTGKQIPCKRSEKKW